MKICSYCREDLPDDATFCTHCGKPLEKVKRDKEEGKASRQQRAQQQKETVKKQKADRNIWIPLGMILFLVALVGLDGIIATIFNSMKWDYKFIFGISTVFYIGAIVCGVMSLIVDNKARKVDMEPSGNYSIAVAEIVVSAYIVLQNVQQILLK